MQEEEKERIFEIRNFIKENKYPTDIPFSQDVVLTGSVMFYLFMEEDRMLKKRKADWKPQNLNLACSFEGYKKVREHLIKLGYSEDSELFKTYDSIRCVEFTHLGKPYPIRVHYSKKRKVVEIVDRFEVYKHYFDGQQVHMDYDNDTHAPFDFSKCEASCAEDALCRGCSLQVSQKIKCARRGIHGVIEFDPLNAKD